MRWGRVPRSRWPRPRWRRPEAAVVAMSFTCDLDSYSQDLQDQHAPPRASARLGAGQEVVRTSPRGARDGRCPDRTGDLLLVRNAARVRRPVCCVPNSAHETRAFPLACCCGLLLPGRFPRRSFALGYTRAATGGWSESVGVHGLVVTAPTPVRLGVVGVSGLEFRLVSRHVESVAASTYLRLLGRSSRTERRRWPPSRTTVSRSFAAPQIVRAPPRTQRTRRFAATNKIFRPCSRR